MLDTSMERIINERFCVHVHVYDENGDERRGNRLAFNTTYKDALAIDHEGFSVQRSAKSLERA